MTNKELVKHFVDEVWNRNQLDLLDELIGDDVVSPGYLPVNRGPEGMRAFIRGFRLAFPDLRIDVVDQVAEGDMVATRWIATGTHRGSFIGFAPTGRPIEVGGIGIDRVVDGKIVQWSGHWDMLTALEQIGAFSAPDPAWLPGDGGLAADLGAVIGREETVAVSRKKALLRHLAVLEAGRSNLLVNEEQTRAAGQRFRERFGITSDSAFERWLEDAGFERREFDSFIGEVMLVDLLEDRLEASLGDRLEAQRKAQTVYTWPQGEQWAQINIALTRRADSAVPSAVAVFDRLWPLVAPSLRATDLRRFFATCKPPDLRLRVGGTDPQTLLVPFLDALRELEAGESVAEFYVVPYEPETARFGGERVMRLTHEWFETDTLAWFRWEALHHGGGNRLSREVLSLAVLNDLFTAVVQDGAEIWDVWRRVAVRHLMTEEVQVAELPRVTIESVATHASQLEGEILEEYGRANRAAAAALDGAARSNELGVGPRQLMETFTLFHWNRLRMPMDARHRIAGGMLLAWDPHC